MQLELEKQKLIDTYIYFPRTLWEARVSWNVTLA